LEKTLHASPARYSFTLRFTPNLSRRMKFNGMPYALYTVFSGENVLPG